MSLRVPAALAAFLSWKPGGDVIILPSISADEAKRKFTNGSKAPKPYLRILPQPE